MAVVTGDRFPVQAGAAAAEFRRNAFDKTGRCSIPKRSRRAVRAYLESASELLLWLAA